MEPIEKTCHSRASGNPVLLIISSGQSNWSFPNKQIIILRNLVYKETITGAGGIPLQVEKEFFEKERGKYKGSSGFVVHRNRVKSL